MKISFKIFFFIILSILQTGCSSNASKFAIPEDSPQAIVVLTAYRMGRHDETRLSLSGPIECESFLWKTHASRKATPIVSVSSVNSKKTAKIPAGKDTLLVIGQNIGDRAGAIFWEMFIKPNAKYEVIVGNEFKDKFLFGSYASTLSIVVIENGSPIKINQIGHPVESTAFAK